MLSSETRAFILALAPVSVTSALAIKGNLAVLRRSAGFPAFVGSESVKCWPPSVSGFPPAKSLDGELTANCAMPRACCTEHCNSTRCSPERKHARVGVCGVGAGYRKLRAKARNWRFRRRAGQPTDGAHGLAGAWRGWGGEGFCGRHEEGYRSHYRLSIVLVGMSFEWDRFGNIGKRPVCPAVRPAVRPAVLTRVRPLISLVLEGGEGQFTHITI